MNTILLEIRYNDESKLIISSKEINGVIFYDLKMPEYFDFSTTLTFITLQDSWEYLKHCNRFWYQLYLVQISTQMIELAKRDYIMTRDKNKDTIDSWLVQLTGRGIGF